jgi:hypothetical protein
MSYYYIQLTQKERYHISALCKEGFPETAEKTIDIIGTVDSTNKCNYWLY